MIVHGKLDPLQLAIVHRDNLLHLLIERCWQHPKQRIGQRHDGQKHDRKLLHKSREATVPREASSGGRCELVSPLWMRATLAPRFLAFGIARLSIEPEVCTTVI
jgi:hypothetical protein